MILGHLRLNVSQSPTIGSKDCVFLGCSFTAGHGLVDSKQCYAGIVSAELGKKCTNLAESGQNNTTMFDQFSHMNFEPGSSLILQLTELSRISVWSDQHKRIECVFLGRNGTRSQVEVFSDEFLIYELMRNLRLTVNLCRAKKVKLVIWSIIRTPGSNNWQILERALKSFPEYVYLESALNLPNSYRVDNASDGTEVLGTGHPGPLSHERIAHQLLAHYRTLYRD